MTDKSIYMAPGAQIIGEVRIGTDSSVWYNAVIRGDSAPIVIGDRSNIQDLACLHVDENYPVEIGNDVTVGHGAIIHGCTIGNRVIVGMGAIIMNGAHIGDDCIIGAGALITENKVIPSGSLVYGNPGKIIRPLSEDEKQGIIHNAQHYVSQAKSLLED